MASEVKFIYFDLGGVLLSFTEAFAEMARFLDCSYEEFTKAFFKYNDVSCLGEITGQQLWFKINEELGEEKGDELEFTEFFTSECVRIDSMVRFVDEVKDKYSIGLFTNIQLGIFEKNIKKGLIPEAEFKVIIKSCDEGLIKPNLEIYRIAQERCGFKANEILLIDDFVENVNAARKMGWHTVHFKTTDPEDSILVIKNHLLK